MSGDTLDIKEIIKFTHKIDASVLMVDEALSEFRDNVIALQKYSERLRIQQRTDMEKWLEDTLTVLYGLERVDYGAREGYESYSIVNDRVKDNYMSWSKQELNRSLDEIQPLFVNAVLNIIQGPLANGKNILVRKTPEYCLTEEGYHKFRCRLLIEKVSDAN